MWVREETTELKKSVITIVGFFFLFISSLSLVVAKTQWKKNISSLSTASSIKLVTQKSLAWKKIH